MKNTLKKTLGIVLALTLTLTAIGCGVAYADAYRDQRPAAPVTVERPAVPATAPEKAAAPAAPAAQPKTIDAETAKALAMDAVGVSAPHVIRTERDEGKFEVTLCDGSTEYDVGIGIASGKVLEIDRDWDGCDRCERDFDDWDDRYDDWDDRWDD